MYKTVIKAITNLYFFPGDIWDTLLKLDQLSSSNKKGKSVARSHSSAGSLKSSSAAEAAASGESDDDSGALSFEHSPFGQLLGMLASPVIRRNSVLTDKLLRLLSLISLGQPDILKKKQSSTTPTTTTTTTTTESTTTTSAAATSDNKDSSAEPSA